MSSPGNGIGQSCAFCGSLDVVWCHPLATDRVTYRQHGEGVTLPTSWALCDRCEHVYASEDDDAAVELMRSSPVWPSMTDEDVAECLRQPLAVFRRADLGALRFDPAPPEVTEATKNGFVPLRAHTGVAAELGPLWPAAHALWVDTLGPLGDEEQDPAIDRWLVRSPWPALSAPEALGALWRWVEQDERPDPPPISRDPRVAEFFRWTEAQAIAFAEHDPEI